MRPRPGLHEDYGRQPELEPGNPRSFGLVMAVAVPAIAFLLVRDWWMAGAVLGAGFLLTALVAPDFLGSLNRAWFRIGILLGRIVAPVVMGALFYLVVTPIGLVRRALGRRSFATRFDREAGSYWDRREPPGPDPRGLPRQF